MLTTSTAVAALVLGASTAWEISAERSRLRREDVASNERFARLTVQPICVSYDLFYSAGFSRFREQLRERLNLAPGVERLRIAALDGRVLFDSLDLEQKAPPLPGERGSLAGPALLEAVKGSDVAHLRSAAGREELVAPYLEDWGRHRLTVIYTLRDDHLRAPLLRAALAAASRALLGTLAFALLFSVVSGRPRQAEASSTP